MLYCKVKSFQFERAVELGFIPVYRYQWLGFIIVAFKQGA